MASTRLQLDQTRVSELGVTIRNAGIAGAGGAGFPTYAKWQRVDEVEGLLINHQESEPNYYLDKWLGRERAGSLSNLLEGLLSSAVERVVIAAKETDRDSWMRPLERATDATIYEPSDLPLDPTTESGVVIAYTEDDYQLGMENILLQRVCDVVIGQDLPMDHGWIVQNTETLARIHDALVEGSAMTRKLVHVDGAVPSHRFLDVPIGTPATDLLEEAGTSLETLPSDVILADGGPGWCFELASDPETFGVRKRTNCLLVLDEATAWENTLGDGRIDVRNVTTWSKGDHETEPSRIEPDHVHLPMLSNPAFEGVVEPSRPIVAEGETVEKGEMIAVPSEAGISNSQHAPIGGTIQDRGSSRITIDGSDQELASDRLYWTWCTECGTYVIPEESVTEATEYVCETCVGS